MASTSQINGLGFKVLIRIKASTRTWTYWTLG
jgi:hypothetical protein